MASDAFAIPDDRIPADKGYQWVTRSVLGEVEKFDQTNKMVLAGWSFVPPERHRDLFPNAQGDSIEVLGLVLMEKDKFEVEKDKTAAYEEAVRLAGKKDSSSGTEVSIQWASGSIRSSPTGKWPRRGRFSGTWSRRMPLMRRLYWWRVAVFWGLTLREIDCSLDGTVIGRDNKPVGIREYARRKRILRKEGRL